MIFLDKDGKPLELIRGKWFSNILTIIRSGNSIKKGIHEKKISDKDYIKSLENELKTREEYILKLEDKALELTDQVDHFKRELGVRKPKPKPAAGPNPFRPNLYGLSSGYPKQSSSSRLLRGSKRPDGFGEKMSSERRKIL